MGSYLKQLKRIVMKKFKTVLTAIVMLVASSAFAAGSENVSPRVKAAFASDFAKAKQVNWEKTSDFYFASFVLNGVRVDAAYNEDGDLVGTSRSISADQMPLNVSLAIAEKYAGYQVSANALELNYEGQTRYYVTVENEKQFIKLKCLSNGDLDVEGKTKK
ncbi:MAG TPA: hypothetical protein DCQ97_01915 [Chitinophagaceae bacterium]|nr:hypothetical protein [Chitinophagaceae bacterium]